MRLTSVAVEGVGCFGVPTRIEGLGPSVNILSAANEAGKSTFFKAIRACLFERHTTKVDSVKNLATEGLALPVSVTLGFDHAGKSYELRKSFLRSAAASLRCDGVEIARNREADETVWDLLGIAPGGGRAVDEAAFGLLWVAQKHSFDAPEPSEAARTALNTVIQNEVGTLVGGERARHILGQLGNELSGLITDTGKPRSGGAFAEALQRAGTLGTELETAQGKLADLDRHLDELQKARAEHRQRSDPAELHRLAAELAQARTALKNGQAAAAVLAQCVTDEELAHALLKSSRSACLSLQEKAGRIDENRRRCAAFQADFATLDEKEESARAILRETTAAIVSLRQEAEAEDADERRLQRLSATIERAAARDGLAARLAVLTGLEDRLARNGAALKASLATEAMVASLDLIEREISNLSARLEAGASRVAIEFMGASPVPLFVDGQSIAADTSRVAVDPVTIELGGEVKITVSPPAGSHATATSQRQDCARKLNQLLESCGAITPSELRRARAARLALENETAGLDAERAALGVKKTRLAEELAGLRADIGGIDAGVALTLAELELAALPDREKVELRRHELSAARKTGRERRVQLDLSAETQNAILESVASERGRLRGIRAEIQNRLDTDVADLPDTGRAQIIQQAEDAWRRDEAQHRAKAIVAEERRKDTPSTEEITRLANRVTRLEEGVENQRAVLSGLDHHIAHLEGQIAAAGGDGLGEKVADLRARLDLATRDGARQTERVETLKLLRDTIEASYNSRREQLNAPLRRHLLPYLNDVFPSAELALGDGFTITGIKRPGPGSETFERLSDGTREQIAVLVRLAMGSMIAERGDEVPIILDDALVFSDDARIEQMFDALSRAGQKQQVIVLTCRSRTFTGLGGRQLKIAKGV